MAPKLKPIRRKKKPAIVRPVDNTNIRFSSPEDYEKVKRAAKLDGRSTNSFIVHTLVKAAEAALAAQSNQPAAPITLDNAS